MDIRQKRQQYMLTPDAALDELMQVAIDKIDELSELITLARAPDGSTVAKTVPPACMFGPGEGYLTEYTPQTCMGFVEWVRKMVRRVRRV